MTLLSNQYFAAFRLRSPTHAASCRWVLKLYGRLDHLFQLTALLLGLAEVQCWRLDCLRWTLGSSLLLASITCLIFKRLGKLLLWQLIRTWLSARTVGPFGSLTRRFARWVVRFETFLRGLNHCAVDNWALIVHVAERSVCISDVSDDLSRENEFPTLVASAQNTVRLIHWHSIDYSLAQVFNMSDGEAL